MGRPSLYSPELIESLCERLSQGEPLAQICRDDGMPGVTTVHDWQNEKDDTGQPTARARHVSEALARAREAGFDMIAADCLTIADDGTNDYYIGKAGPVFDGEHVQRSRLRIDTRLKLLKVWDPKRYGERVQLADAEGGMLPPAPAFVVLPVAPPPREDADE